MSKESSTAQPTRLSIAITGSGGSGAVISGSILLAAVDRAGFYGLMTRSAGPQIRGGESAAMVRFGPSPVTCLDDRFDILVAAWSSPTPPKVPCPRRSWPPAP